MGVTLLASCSGSTSRTAALAPEPDVSAAPAGDPAAIATPTPTPDAEPTPTPQGPRPLVIVTILGETGVMAPLDRPALGGVLATVEELNAAGGLLGRPIEVRRLDTTSRTSVAERRGGFLLEAQPDLVIVSCDVDFVGPVLTQAAAQGLVTISPCADDRGYTTGSHGGRNFTLGAPSGLQGEIAAQIAVERYGRDAMVLRDTTSPEAIAFCDGFERTFAGLGGVVTYRDEFTFDSLLPVRDRLDKHGVVSSFTVVCSHVPGELKGAPNIVSMLRDGGFATPIVSGSTLDEATWFAKVPLLGELTYVSWSSIYGNDPNPAVNDLIDRVNTAAVETAGDPAIAGVTTVLGADAVTAWARAVQAVRSAEPSQVAAALGAFVDEPLLSGEVSFVGGVRMDDSRTLRVMRVRDNAVEAPVRVDS